MPPRRLLALLSALYVSQGIPHGFFTGAFPVYLRERDFSLRAIGLTTLLFLPWALKFAWAPLADRWGWTALGLRRSWVLPAQLAMVAGMVGGALLVGTGGGVSGLLLATVLVVNLASATQDVAVDGLACDFLEPRWRGLGNAAQTGGYRLGMLLGGGVILAVAEWVGWQGAFFAVAGGLLLLFLVPLGWREPARKPKRSARGGAWRAFCLLFRRRGAWALVLFVLTAKIGETMAATFYRVWAWELGISKASLGFWLGSVGVATGIAGSVLGGVILWRLPRRPYLLGVGLLHAAVIGALALAAGRGAGPGGAIALLLVEEAVGALFTVGVFTLMMDGVDPRAAASGYAVLASLEVAGKVLASSVGGYLAEPWGYAAFFGFCALASLPPLLLLVRVPAIRPGGALRADSSTAPREGTTV